MPFFFSLNNTSTTKFYFFFFNDTATTEIYTLSLHDALPISSPRPWIPTSNCSASRASRNSSPASWSAPSSYSRNASSKPSKTSPAAPTRTTTSRFSSCATALPQPLPRRTPMSPCRLRPPTPPQPLLLPGLPQMPHLLLRRGSIPAPPLWQGLVTCNRDALVARLFPDGSGI